MTVFINGQKQEITIDKVYEFYEKIQEYLEYIKNMLNIKND